MNYNIPEPTFIFLSYSRSDAWQARAIAAEMRLAGCNLWIDNKLEPGTPDWMNAIENSVRESSCIVCICSPSACDSEWVAKELNFAHSMHKPIYPVWVAGEHQDESIPQAIRSVQAVDFRRDYQLSLERLISSIYKHHDDSTDLDIRAIKSGSGVDVLRFGSLFWFASEVRKLRLLLVPEVFQRQRFLDSLGQLKHHALRLNATKYTLRDIEHVQSAIEHIPESPQGSDRQSLETKLRQIQDNVAETAERMDKFFSGGPFSGAPVYLKNSPSTHTPDDTASEA